MWAFRGARASKFGLMGFGVQSFMGFPLPGLKADPAS